MTPRARLGDARLYLVCDTEPGGRALEPFLRACLRGGVDLIQLRDKDASDPELLAAARTFRTLADEHGALFILNDRPDLVDAASADGVHLGQDDEAPAAARAAIGPDRIIGRSTHAPAQADAAEADPDVDYLAVGPVHATPTKPGRPAAGPDYLAYAAEQVHKPWFAIGGLDTTTLPAAVALGARRVVVVRALTGAAEPGPAARALRALLEVPVGAARR
jgi:thiamine-phosphate pyrophosphorylase